MLYWNTPVAELQFNQMSRAAREDPQFLAKYDATFYFIICKAVLNINEKNYTIPEEKLRLTIRRALYENASQYINTYVQSDVKCGGPQMPTISFGFTHSVCMGLRSVPVSRQRGPGFPFCCTVYCLVSTEIACCN